MDRISVFFKAVFVCIASYFLLAAGNPAALQQATEARIANAYVDKQEPSKEIMKAGKLNYERFCGSCHANNGEGATGPAIKGSKIATGFISPHIIFVLKGPHDPKMPTWGISEISDETLAEIITYQRNSWGNNDTKKYGEQAGGVVTSIMVKQHRDAMKEKPQPSNIRM